MHGKATNLQVISRRTLVVAKVLLNLRVGLQLLPEDIVFVQEEDNARLGKPLGVADLSEKKEERRNQRSSSSSRRGDERG